MKATRLVLAGVALAVALAAAAIADQELMLTTSDGVKIAATYVDTGKRNSKALILVHMLNRQRQDWQAFAADAKVKGFCTVAIDLRGHGSSISGPGGQKLAWKSFGDAQFQAVLKDIQAAHDFLLKQQNVDPNAVAIVGASIGANLAAVYAAQHPGQIKRVVLMSPGEEYHGVKPGPAIQQYPGKMLFYAAPGDEYSYKSVTAFVASAKDRATFTKLDGDGHGTQLLKQYPEQIGRILSWLSQGQ